jgi:hypothetical protein
MHRKQEAPVMAIDIVDGMVILVYLLAIVGVGYYASTRVKSSADYAVAGRSMSFPVLCGTLIGTTIGAAATMGKAGKAYEAGFAVLYASIAYMVGYALMAFFASRLRSANIDSMPDVLQRRYGKSMRIVGAVILLLAAVPVMGIQLTACGLIVTQFLPDLGIGFTEAVIIAAIVIVVYTLLGGLLAVALTDLMQVGIMFLGIGVLLPLLLFFEVGTLEGVKAVLEPPVDGWLGGLDLAYTLSGPGLHPVVLPGVYRHGVDRSQCLAAYRGGETGRGPATGHVSHRRIFRLLERAGGGPGGGGLQSVPDPARGRPGHTADDRRLHAAGVERHLPGGDYRPDHVHRRQYAADLRHHGQLGYRAGAAAGDGGPVPVTDQPGGYPRGWRVEYFLCADAYPPV